MLGLKLQLPAIAAALAVLAFNGAALAESASEIPANSYYDDPLSASERSGIAQEESVTPNDGRASVPNAQDDGVIPDAAVDQNKLDSGNASPNPETAEKKKAGESEANAVINDSKKNYKVSKKDLQSCLNDWGPQTQMTKEEWAASCRTTLEYFPDGE